jgi:hypothetical protein
MPNSRSGGGRPPKKSRRRPRPRSVEVSQPVLGVEEVRALCRRMAESPSIEAALDLETRSGELENFFGTIRKRAEHYRSSVQEGKRAEQERREVLAALRKSFETEGIASPPSEPLRALEGEEGFAGGEEFFATAVPLRRASQPENPFDLSDFFKNVSSAVVNAQQALNQSSLRYARQFVGTAIPPSVYSIPNVKAEIKLGITDVTGGGIKAILGGETTTTSSESTISFDVAASPPPPGKIGDFTSPVPPFLPVTGPDRDQALAPVRNLAAGAPPAPLQGDWESRAVVLRDVSAGLGNADKWFAVVLVPAPPPADPQADPNSVDIGVYAIDTGQATQVRISGGTLTGPADALRAALVHAARSIAAWIDSIRISDRT